MKKLMCAIAAVSAGICLADVSSANVVGYQNKTKMTVGEYNMLTSTFLPVGTDGANAVLGNIKANRDFAFGSDTVMFLKPNGATLASYTFCTAEEGEEYGITEGWYDYNYINNEWDWESQPPVFNNTPMPFGKMVIVQTGSEDAQLMFAGQVLDYDKDFSFIVGEYNMLGNATPLDRILGDFVANRDFAFGSDTLMTLKGNGATLASYTFCTAEEGADYGITAGWYDYNYINNEWDWESQPPTYNNLPIPSGYGFIIQAGSEDAVLTLPSAI